MIICGVDRRDSLVCEMARSAGVEVITSVSHTLHDPER